MATPTADIFGGQKPDIGSPVYSGVFAITPGSPLPLPTRAIWVGGAGALAITDLYGSSVTLAAVPVGLLPLRVAAVNASGTTATGLVGLF